MNSVKATKAFQVYWNYQVWTLAEGQQVDGELADYLLATGSPVEEIETGPAVDADGDGVPDGTVAQVLEWVGDDPGRARQALDAENGRDKPRSSLVVALQKTAGDGSAPAAPAPDDPPAS